MPRRQSETSGNARSNLTVEEAKQPVKEPAQQRVQQPAQQPAQQPVQQPAQQPVKQVSCHGSRDLFSRKLAADGEGFCWESESTLMYMVLTLKFVYLN